MEITVRNKRYELKQGDYIVDNGAGVMLVAGDGRILYTRGKKWYSHVLMPRTDLKKIADKLTSREKYGNQYYYYGDPITD